MTENNRSLKSQYLTKCGQVENIAETAFENGAYNAAVSAVKELNQLAGLTIHRSQNLNINADLQKMTKDDIKHRLNELLGVDSEMSDKDH